MKKTVTDIMSIVTLDSKKKCRRTITLKDKDGDTVSTKEVIQQVAEYVSDKLKDEKGNQFTDELVPLMAQAMVVGMTKLYGETLAAILLSDELTRHGILQMMLTSFVAIKFLQKKDISIVSHSEHISEAELASYIRTSQASDAIVKGQMLGLNATQMLEGLVKSGKIQADDLKKLGVDEETADKLLACLAPLNKETN